MKSDQIEIKIEFPRYTTSWKVGFLEFIFGLLGLRKDGVSVDRWYITHFWNSKQYKWVEVKPSTKKEK